ncbi:flippase, partial [Salmonella enterica subsp. enterica serovar Soerenga]|nr:flippase [Salmonella enterica subsp. enterica serovar Soerenga]
RINVKKETPYLISNGFFFFILQMGTLATWSGDNFIISTTLGVTYVSILSITQRLFQISTVPLTIYNAPLWAAYADAHARNDVDFIRKTLLGSLKIVGISSTTLALILVIFGQSIIAIWTGEELRVPQSLIVAYAVWSIIDAYSNTLSSFLNGLNIIKQQVFAVVTLILISIPSKYFIVS